MPGYIRLESAIDLTLTDGSHVSSPNEYRLWAMQRLAEKGVAVPWECHLPVLAHVRQGRWVGQCPNCGGHSFTFPQWKLLCCSECGCFSTRVITPNDFVLIEKELLVRSRRENQNWLPGETVEDLRKELETHFGLGYA